MSKVLFRFLMVLLFTSLACTVPFLGVDINEWFVAPTGRDTNTCTSAGQPCRTIQGALTKAKQIVDWDQLVKDLNLAPAWMHPIFRELARG